MNNPERDCLTEQHFVLFGATIHWFAKYEVLDLSQIVDNLAGNYESFSAYLLVDGLVVR